MSATTPDLTEALRARKRAPTGHKHPVNRRHYQEATRGQRLADRMASVLGSWPFLIAQSAFMTAWIVVNAIGVFALHWDPYPFIFLNLLLSFQATYAGPILLLAANRQSQRDRMTLEHAAREAEQGDERVRQILDQIQENTRMTNRILAELQSEPAGRGPAR